MKKLLVLLAVIIFHGLALPPCSSAQKQYKLRQVVHMNNMKIESTIYVKGMQKRTETPGMMGSGAQTYIEQCDLRRIVYLNDKKKLYFIEPFVTREEQVIEENKQEPLQPNKVSTRKGGVITIWSNIRDTGERKQMFGFTARHIWTSQKIVPSADACFMKDSMQMKTDGWYIDLPEFKCPHGDADGGGFARQSYQPDCMDRFVTHNSGKGKLGFPLIQTTVIIMGGKATEITTTLETLEFTTAKLDSMLFEIPPGYQQAKSRDELQDQTDMNEMMKNIEKEHADKSKAPAAEAKKPGTIRIGVLAPTGNNDVKPAVLQNQMADAITTPNIKGFAISSEEEAKRLECDFILHTRITELKQATKAGGILKAIKKGDPTAASSYNIQASFSLKQVSDLTIRIQIKVDDKYEGLIDAAAGRALEEGCKQVLKALVGD